LTTQQKIGGRKNDSFPSLPPGAYELKVEQTGFKISLNDNTQSISIEDA
jgi:hypothetical protein